jgi:hypothetical protein
VSGAGHRRLQILSLLVGHPSRGADTPRLCEVSVEVTGMSGAGIMLMAGDIPRGSVCTSDSVSDRIEQLQYMLGEGPCIDAYHQDQPVLEPDLAAPASVRWPAFSGAATDAGVAAVFAFPLRVGAVRLGALNLYRDRRGPPSNDQHSDSLVMADVAAQAVLASQAGAPLGTVAVDLESGADFQYVVHQASGMVAAQLDVGVAQALIRLRAYAFTNERSLADVAREVVDRTLRFGPETDPGDVAP